MDNLRSKIIEKRICLQRDLYYWPLTYGLEQEDVSHQFIIEYGNEPEAASKLKEGEVNVSLISAIDYGKKRESWRIIPDIAVSLISGSNSILLFFRKGLKEINTVATDRHASTAMVLLQIILREKFNSIPEYIPMESDLDTMLETADAAMLSSTKAMVERRENRLDLCEEWFDLTGLPFVYGFWAGLEIATQKEDLVTLKKSFDLGKKNIEKISKKYAQKNNDNWTRYHDILTKNIKYSFDEEAKQGLQEFYNYAFFYGFSEFIPDLLFFKL
jgi:chorismate dehydratase